MIIGITGTHGAGKGTVVAYLSQRGFKHVAISDTFLAGEAVRRGLAPDRPTRRSIANEYRAKGPTALMEEVCKLAEDEIKNGTDVIIEPQHTAAEVDFIKSLGGIEIAVDADLAIRYGRIHKRGSSKDCISFEVFKEHHNFEIEQTDPNKNNLAAAMRKADFVLMNNGSVYELYKAVDEVLSKIK
jgi:dephospho-CoA kinase